MCAGKSRAGDNQWEDQWRGVIRKRLDERHLVLKKKKNSMKHFDNWKQQTTKLFDPHAQQQQKLDVPSRYLPVWRWSSYLWSSVVGGSPSSTLQAHQCRLYHLQLSSPSSFSFFFTVLRGHFSPLLLSRSPPPPPPPPSSSPTFVHYL